MPGQSLADRRSPRRSCWLLSLLLIPFVGAEFMPQLDEGALWVRATMPYTISYDESAKITPQIRDMLKTFPEVTTVASELGRPDDGTDSTGFFNVEFYVGLKPYSEWNGTYRTKAALIEAINKKLQAFPGIIFNYTQPAEDAVDEAETGLKSALAVKVFGSDLNTLQDKGKAIKQILEQVRGITDVTLVQELGQPSLTIKIDRAKIARYGLNVDDVNDLITDRHRRRRGHPGGAGEKQFDLVVRLERQYRDNPEEIGNIPVATPGGQQIPLKELADIQVTNGASFIYREDNSRYIGVQFSVRRARSGRRGGRRHRAGEPEGDAAAGLSPGLGRRIYRIHRLARAAECHPAADPVPDLPAAVRALQQFQIPLHHRAGRAAVGAGGRHCGAVAHRHAVLGLVGHRLPGLFGVSVQTAVVYISYVNELRRDGMPIARGHPRRRDPAAAADHDDGAGGGAGPVAGGARHRRGHRYPEALRPGDRQRPVHPASDQRFL